jgi:hypothetical protein
MGSSLDWINPKAMKLIFVSSQLSMRHVVFRRKSKARLAGNHDTMSLSGDMSIHILLFQLTNYIKHVGLVQSRPHHHFIEN